MRKFVLLVLAVVFGWSSGASAAPINSGLVAGYEFNGNADDVSGNGNDGVVNGATLTADRFGNVDSAYSFDGVDDYIEAADSPTLDFSSSQLSVSAWVNSDALTRGTHERIVGRWSGVGSEREFFLGLNNDNTFEFGLSPDGTGPPAGDTFVYSTTTVALNNWVHVAGTWDGTTARIYIDGTEESSEAYSSGLIDGGASLYIGTDELNSWGYYNFDGSIDDVYIYDRALSASEVGTLFSAVPEPSTALLLGAGLAGLAMRRRG